MMFLLTGFYLGVDGVDQLNYGAPLTSSVGAGVYPFMEYLMYPFK